MKINYSNVKSKFKVNFYDKKRDSTIEFARIFMAMMITFTHMYAFTSIHGKTDGAAIAKIMRTIGGMCTVVFMMFSGYYYAGKPGANRWFKILMSWLMLLFLNWILSAIWISASGWLYVGGDNSHLVSAKYFWAHAMGRHGWLNLLLVGNDTHWYMWQFIIAMVFYPFITLGLKTYGKKTYLLTALGLLILDTVFKIAIGLGFLENSLGGFLGNYGGDTSYAPWNGYSWTLMLIAFIFAGYFRLHVKREEKGRWGKVALYWGIALTLILTYSLIWAFVKTNDGTYLRHIGSGYGNSIVDGYGTYLSADGAAHLYGGHNLDIVNKYHATKTAAEAATATATDKANFAAAKADYDAYKSELGQDFNAIKRFNWLGFLEGGNYVPTLALASSCFIFAGIINLPMTHSKILGVIGSTSFAYYALHMTIVTAVMMMMNSQFHWVQDGSTQVAVKSDIFAEVKDSNVLNNGTYFVKDASGGWYILTNFIVVIFSMPFAFLGTYIMKVGNNFLAPMYEKIFKSNTHEKSEQTADTTKRV